MLRIFKNNASTKNSIDYLNAVSALSAHLSQRVTLPDLRLQAVLKEIPQPPPGHISLPSFYVHVVDESKLYEWFGIDDDTRQAGALPGLWSFVSELVPDAFGENHVALELTTRNFALNFDLFSVSARDVNVNPRVTQLSSRGLVTSVHYGHRCVLSVNTTVLLPDTAEVSVDFEEISRAVQNGLTSLMNQRAEFLQGFEEQFPYTRFNAKITCSQFMPIIKGEDIAEDIEDQVNEEYETDDEIVTTAVNEPIQEEMNHVSEAHSTDLVLENVNATGLVHQIDTWMSQRVKVELLTELFESAVPLSINVKRITPNITDYSAVPNELVFESECMHVISQTPVSLFLLTSVTQLTVFALFVAVVFFSLTVLLTLGNIVHLLKHFYGVSVPFVRVHESAMHLRLPYVTYRMYEENEGYAASGGGN